VEFSSSLAAGATGSVVAAVLLRYVWRAFGLARADMGTWVESQYLVIHAVWGLAFGLLFWLSWGLTAIVSVSWWWRGTAFGLLCGGVIVLPVLWIARLLLNWPWRTVAALLSDAVATSLSAGLLCAWTWAHST
jgi:hypothetical protein